MNRRVLAVLAVGWAGACTVVPPTSTDRPSVRPEPDRATPESLQGPALYATLHELLALPRWLGAPERDHGIDGLVEMAEARGATLMRQPFEGVDPKTGRTYALVNLYASVRPDAPLQFVIGTHFDIRPWAEEDADPQRRSQPIAGANDGTSGVAVALGLLDALARDLPATVGFTVIFFDGEELGRPEHGGYCAGSRHFADAPNAVPDNVRRAAFGIVLDMVGDADLQISIEPRSHRYNPELVDEVWATAARVQAPAFVPQEGRTGIIDDHVGLTEAGIPSILLIDYDYPPWHTHQDTADKVTPESLQTVAVVVYEAVLAHYAR